MIRDLKWQAARFGDEVRMVVLARWDSQQMAMG